MGKKLLVAAVTLLFKSYAKMKILRIVAVNIM